MGCGPQLFGTEKFKNTPSLRHKAAAHRPWPREFKPAPDAAALVRDPRHFCRAGTAQVGTPVASWQARHNRPPLGLIARKNRCHRSVSSAVWGRSKNPGGQAADRSRKTKAHGEPSLLIRSIFPPRKFLAAPKHFALRRFSGPFLWKPHPLVPASWEVSCVAQLCHDINKKEPPGKALLAGALFNLGVEERIARPRENPRPYAPAF